MRKESHKQQITLNLKAFKPGKFNEYINKRNKSSITVELNHKRKDKVIYF